MVEGFKTRCEKLPQYYKSPSQGTTGANVCNIPVQKYVLHL